MLIYCHAFGSFHYKMEKERWMFFYIFFFDCDICRTVPPIEMSSWVVKHSVLIYCKHILLMGWSFGYTTGLHLKFPYEHFWQVVKV